MAQGMCCLIFSSLHLATLTDDRKTKARTRPGVPSLSPVEIWRGTKLWWTDKWWRKSKRALLCGVDGTHKNESQSA